jgi:hypothetical protein
MPYWDDLAIARFEDGYGGIFDNVTGSAGNRVYEIQYEAVNKSADFRRVAYIVRFFENSQTQRFSVLYIRNDGTSGNTATSGVQEQYVNQIGRYTQYSCNQDILTTNTLLNFDYLACVIP